MMHQRSPFEPTWLNFTVHSAKNELRENTEYLRDLAGFQIRSLPPDPTMANKMTHCDSCGPIYNPSNVDRQNRPPAGYGTQGNVDCHWYREISNKLSIYVRPLRSAIDQYAVGDLSGKLQMRNREYPHRYLLPLTPGNELNGIYWDVFLPLQGINSVTHRGITIEKYNRIESKDANDTSAAPTSIWACATITLYQENRQYQMPMVAAQVHFRYPIVGKILFRQPRDEPLHDTIIIIE